VVVEAIRRGNTLSDAGVRPGDVLRSWERLPSPPENPEPAAGELSSPFDWDWVVYEQSMRGTLRFVGERQGQPLTWTVPPGLLQNAEVRPVLPIEQQEAYERGRALLESQAAAVAIDCWTVTPDLLQKAEVRPALPMGKLETEEHGRELLSPEAAEAIDCWRRLAEDFRRAGDWRRASWLSLRIARSLADRRILGEAEAAYQRALSEARDPRSMASVLWWMADFYQTHGHLAEADACDLAKLRLEAATWGECLEAAESLWQLGWGADRQGRPTTAVEYYQQALAIQKRLAPRSRATGKSLLFLGTLSADQGELAAAERYLRAALAMYLELAPAAPAIAVILNDLGSVYFSQGDRDLAEAFFRRALQHETETGSTSRSIAVGLANLGEIARSRGDTTTAEHLLQQSLRLSEKLVPDSLDVSQVLADLGQLALERGDLQGAEDGFQRALTIVEDLGLIVMGRAALLTDLGTVCARRGEIQRAEGYFRASLALSQRLAPESGQRAETLHLLAGVLRQKGSPAQAERELTRAVEILEGQVGHLGGSPEVKGAFRAQEGAIYRDAVRQEVELGHPQEAFRLLERFRAQTFLTLLAERDLAFSADIPPALDRERRRLTTLYDANELRLATLDPDREGAATEELRREQVHLRQQREEIAAEIRRASPRLAAMIHPQTLTAEQVRAALDPGTVMLSYSVGKEETQLFVVTPGQEIAVRTIPLGEADLRKEVLHLRQLIDQVRTRSGLNAEGLDRESRRLYRFLVQPAEPWIAAAKRIVLVPDGPLHLLPFAALIREPAPEKKTGRGGQYLIEWKPLHTTLSGTVYAELKEHRRASGATAGPLQWVGFGDPWFPPRLAEGRSQAAGETRLRSFSTRTGLHWQRLPASRREVERIAGLYPPAGRRIYLDREASEERAKALGREARIVHFATHGFVDDRSPFDSGLVLAIPEPFVEGHDNGLLQVWEIFESVRLDADLVVLSACETGLGEIRGGEGIIGLTRAFQYAGAHAVLASLWQVDDRATAELMERFYRHLRGGENKDEALRSAQLELLGSPDGPRSRRAAAPHYWASMQLYGDGQ